MSWLEVNLPGTTISAFCLSSRGGGGRDRLPCGLRCFGGLNIAMVINAAEMSTLVRQKYSTP